MDAAHEGNFVVRLGCGGLLRVQWHTPWGRPTTNANGTSGWVTVIGYDGEQPAPAAVGAVTRLHVCKHRPCGAVYPASKYGSFPPPIHGHLAPEATAAAAAVAATAPEATAAAAAVATTAPEATAAAAAVAAGAPGSVALPTNLQPAPHHGQMGRFHVHRVPLAGQLVAQPLALATASAPAPPGDAPLPMSGDDSHGCGDIRAAMVAHAHYLRRQGTYVGQVALVLFCISRGVRLHLWEGGTRTDLVSLYAPWAAEHCPEEKTLWADVIAVHLSHGELHYICDTVPLGRVNHFVVGEPLVLVSGDASGSHGSGEAASWCGAFYQRLGLRVRETIADGDCALDALCIVSVADRTLASRNAIRAELSNLLLNSLGNSLMETHLRCVKNTQSRALARTHPRLWGAISQGRQMAQSRAATKRRRHSLGRVASRMRPAQWWAVFDRRSLSGVWRG